MKMQGQRPREDSAGNSPTLGSPCHLPPQNPGVSRGGRPTASSSCPTVRGRVAGRQDQNASQTQPGLGAGVSGSRGSAGSPGAAPGRGQQGRRVTLRVSPRPRWPTRSARHGAPRTAPCGQGPRRLLPPESGRVKGPGVRGPGWAAGVPGQCRSARGGHGGGVPRPGRWWPSTPSVRVTEAARGSCASEWHCCRAGQAWPTCAGEQGLPRFTPVATQEVPFSPGGQLQREGKEWGARVAECGASAWAPPSPRPPRLVLGRGWPRRQCYCKPCTLAQGPPARSGPRCCPPCCRALERGSGPRASRPRAAP